MFATPAALQAASETPTVYGGLTSTWTLAANLWIDLAPGSSSWSQLEDQRPTRIETASAVARDDLRACAGQQLLAGADPNPWRVIAVQRARPEPGRMTLLLDRVS